MFSRQSGARWLREFITPACRWGVGASTQLAAVLEPHFGWRFCFYVLGGMGLFVVPVLLMIKDPQRQVAVVTADEQPKEKLSSIKILMIL